MKPSVGRLPLLHLRNLTGTALTGTLGSSQSEAKAQSLVQAGWTVKPKLRACPSEQSPHQRVRVRPDSQPRDRIPGQETESPAGSGQG